MAGNPYRDQKGHLTTQVNDGGPCYHQKRKAEDYKSRSNGKISEEKVKASRLLGTDLKSEDKQQKVQNLKFVFMYNEKEVVVEKVTNENNTRIIYLKDKEFDSDEENDYESTN